MMATTWDEIVKELHKRNDIAPLQNRTTFTAINFAAFLNRHGMEPPKSFSVGMIGDVKFDFSDVIYEAIEIHGEEIKYDIIVGG